MIERTLGKEQPKAIFHYEPQWWRVALASIGDAVITADVEGRLTFMNPVAEYLTGWTLEEAQGQPLDSVLRMINEESRQSVENLTVRTMREDMAIKLAKHMLLITKDGTERPIDHSSAPIRNEQGEIVGVVLVFRDVTEHRRQDRLVQEALTYAESIIATVREPLIVLDRDLRVKTANRSFYRTFHVSKEETEEFSFFKLGNGQWDIPELRTLLEKILPQNHSFQDFEVEHDFPAIGRRTMLLNARRFVAGDCRPELILLAIEDITDRKWAEHQIKASELRYRRLFETAQDGILILDANTGKIITANPFVLELLGYTHDDLRGRELWQIGLFRDTGANRSLYRLLKERGHVRYDHLPLEGKNGQQIDIEFVSNVYSEGDRAIIQCNIRDITARRQLERAQAQAEAAADLNRRKDEFLAMLSHELRNPLAPIVNALYLLRMEQANETPIQRRAKSIIERQVNQLSRLVDDLLEVSRITTGRIQLRRERVDVNGIVAHAVEAVRPLIDQRKHELTVSLPPEHISLYADAARLEQVIVNLLTNAAKYTEVGGRIGLTVQQEGREAVLRVQDNGLGISPDLLPRIFDLFTQGEQTLARSSGGLGIGLTLVRKLVELHGGKVEAHSTLGQGSDFIVRLPIVASSAPTQPASPQETAEQLCGPPSRVLVVDDNLDAAESLAMLVKTLGHEVRTAYDGPTALETALNYRPDVVLLDIGLPGLDGYEVARRMREQPIYRDVVLIALTGYGQDADRLRSREAGFAAHLVKPADFEKMRQVLALAVKKGHIGSDEITQTRS